ncbi:MAG: hut operon positive regulator HutP [Firmicutes bacterium]|jgi:hypothetical protein|nr:hut operon positive regulator HutP [Bacillota bacterium]
MRATQSKDVARAAILMALTREREEEDHLQDELERQGVKAAAADYGGEFLPAVQRIIERAVVAAKREGVIKATHAEEGAVAGATHEALAQVSRKALGLNVGGKIGIARHGEHVAVAIYLCVGLLHLDDVTIGLGHRAVPSR